MKPNKKNKKHLTCPNCKKHLKHTSVYRCPYCLEIIDLVLPSTIEDDEDNEDVEIEYEDQ